MRFWDSSALVPLFVQQARSDDVRAALATDSGVAAWTLSEVEYRSALCRLLREGAVDAAGFDKAWSQFQQMWLGARIIAAIEPVKSRAKRILGTHPLRAADSMQLAAALVATYDQPGALEFVSLDGRLMDAARREGFRVLP